MQLMEGMSDSERSLFKRLIKLVPAESMNYLIYYFSDVVTMLLEPKLSAQELIEFKNRNYAAQQNDGS